MSGSAQRPIRASEYRQVLGHLPTGVVAVTAVDRHGAPIGMVVGSFVSVSLDPPLVAFLSDKSSSSFPRIREAGSFCANVLGAGQQLVCRALAAKGVDKFSGLSWRPSTRTTAPVLDGVLAWVDCEIVSVSDAGDHHFVLARVLELEAISDAPPLVFFRGGYGAFAASSLTAPAKPELLQALRVVDLARPSMQWVAREVGAECLASVVVGDYIEVVGSAGRAGSRIGQRSPFLAPLGAGLAAWSGASTRNRWLGGADEGFSASFDYAQMLSRVRSRGWSIVVDSAPQRALEGAVAEAQGDEADPDGKGSVAMASRLLDPRDYEPTDLDEALVRGLRSISAPVLDRNGEVALLLTIYGCPEPSEHRWFELACARLTGAALHVSQQLCSQGSAASHYQEVLS